MSGPRTWCIMRVNDDGRAHVVPTFEELTAEAACLIAGALRDEQTEADIDAGWNIKAFGRADARRILSRTNSEGAAGGQ